MGRLPQFPGGSRVLDYDLVDVERVQFTGALPVDCVAHVANERCLLIFVVRSDLGACGSSR